MRIRGLLAAGLAVAVLSGCNAFPTQGNYRRIVEQWMGHRADELTYRWGRPAYLYENPERKQILVYVRYYAPDTPREDEYVVMREGGFLNGVYYPPLYRKVEAVREPPKPHPLSCTTQFYTDTAGVIRDWKMDGNYCYAYSSKTIKKPKPRKKEAAPPKTTTPR